MYCKPGKNSRAKTKLCAAFFVGEMAIEERFLLKINNCHT